MFTPAAQTSRRVLILGLLILVAVGGFIWLKLQSTAEAFQLDADVIRLRHLKHYGFLVEEYHEKTGAYPFQGSSEAPIYVHIANDQQASYAEGGPPTPHRKISVAEFFSELESGLGRTVKERYDPQLHPSGKPNFYIYMMHQDYYFFAVHLHQPFPFAKKVSQHYHKAEISNAANEHNEASSLRQLLETPAFATAIETRVVKPGFFANREKQYEHFTKRK